MKLLSVGSLLCGGLLIAQMPADNVSAKKHPNLAAAQHLVDQAYQRILAGQQANEYDLGGHAKKAEELLDKANAELKLAAQTANANHK